MKSAELLVQVKTPRHYSQLGRNYFGCVYSGVWSGD